MTTANSRGAVISKPVRVETEQARVADRVFVSPRVVDEHAFGEFAAELRGLIDEAREAQARLGTAGDEAGQTAKTLAGTQDKYRRQLDLTTKLLKALSAKSDEVEAIVRSLDERTARATNAERAAVETLAQRASAFEASLEARLKRAEAEYEERLSRLEERFEARRAAIEGEMSALEGRLGERLERQRESLEQRVSEQIEHAERALGERAAGLAQATIERLSQERERAETAIAELTERHDAFASSTGDSLEHTLAQLREACAIGVKLIGWDPADPSADPDRPVEGSLGHLVRKAVTARDDAEWSVRRLGSLREQATKAVDELGESFEASISLLDQLHAQRTKLNTEIESVLERARGTEAGIEGHEQRLRELIAPVDEAATRAEAALRDLCSAASGAAETAQDCERSRDELRGLAEQLQGLADRLEPWRSAMLGEGAPEALPAPLATIVAKFEDELGRDLSAMADTIESLMARAGTGQR